MVVLGVVCLVVGLWSIWKGMAKPISQQINTTSPLRRDSDAAARLAAQNKQWAQGELNRYTRTARWLYVGAGSVLVVMGSLCVSIGVIELLFLMPR